MWAVEIISPTDKAKDIRKKRKVYRDAGILLWEMYSELPNIDVYAPGKPEQVVGIDGILDGGDVLPDFKLAVRDLFTRAE